MMKAMGRNVIYKAYIEVADLDVPVRFFSAVRSERVRFRLLHAEDGQPLERRMVCPKHEKPIPQEERARGYEVARGEFVVLNRDELAELRPESSRRIEVLKFVDAAEIDPRMLDRPYYLDPDAESEEACALLVRALDKSGKAAVCRWTMRRRSHHGLLQTVDGTLLMTTMRHAHELVGSDEFEIKQTDYSDKEFDSACQLIDELTDEFEPEEYQDDYQQRLMRFIEDKAKGQKPKMKTPKRRKPTTPGKLRAALQKSLEKARAG